jgi:hypothetical protein
MRKFLLTIVAFLLFLLLCAPALAFNDGPWGERVVDYVIKTAAPTVNDDTYAVSTMWCDTTNDEIYLLIDNTSGAAVWTQVVAPSAISADLLPTTDNTYDLGSGTYEWKDLYVDGTANIDSLVADTADINGGTIDAATIGATTPSTGVFTTVNTGQGAYELYAMNQDVETTDAVQFDSIEVGHASDTTLARSGSGDITIEGNVVYRAGGTDVAIADGGTNSGTALNNDRVMVSSGDAIVESGDITTTELGLLNGMASVSTGTSDNDKLVTQGYVDDNAGSTAYDDIGDPDAATTIAFSDTETITYNTAQASAGSFFTITDTTADLSSTIYLLELAHNDTSDLTETDARYIKCVSDADGSPATVWEVINNGEVTQNGELTLSGTYAHIDIDYSTNTADGITVTHTAGDITSERHLLRLEYNDDADPDADFIICRDDADGSPATLYEVAYDGSVTNAGKVINSPITVSVTTEADFTPTSTVVLLEGDDDEDNDTIDLQDGSTAGQRLVLIANANVDANDTITVAFTDTTATNAPAVAFDKVGENATLIWTGAMWVVPSLQDSL